LSHRSGYEIAKDVVDVIRCFINTLQPCGSFFGQCGSDDHSERISDTQIEFSDQNDSPLRFRSSAFAGWPKEKRTPQEHQGFPLPSHFKIVFDALVPNLSNPKSMP
jgi:hypothetical protein